MTVKKHLTLSQRIIIENGLREGKKIAKIAKEAKVSRSTVKREIKAYRYDKLEWSCRFGGQNWCVKRSECGVFGVCKGELADKKALERWGTTHAGALVTPEELKRYDALICDGLKNGRSIYVTYTTNGSRFNCSLRTLYQYVNDGRFSKSKRGDLPRACMIRPKKRKACEHKIDKACCKGTSS